MGIEVSRRNFLKGAIAAGAATAVAGGLMGCSPSSSNGNSAASEENGSSSDLEASEVRETQVVICGAGISGLAAAVQAADCGLQAIVVEKASEVGGNGIGVEGVFGVNTSGQKEQGIEVDPGEVLKHELSFAQYRPDGVLWRDLISSSADNYEWMLEHGVRFSGQIDAYGGLFETMHWFEGGVAATGYVPYMEQAARDGGVEFMTDTSARQLVMTDGKVTGVLVEGEDGAVTQINAQAVVIATGGFGSNVDMIAEAGWPTEHLSAIGTTGHDGDGYAMCVEVGGASAIADSCSLCGPGIAGMDSKSSAAMAITFGGAFLWVDAQGNRCVNEDLSVNNMMNIAIPMQEQREIWCLGTQSIIDEAFKTSSNPAAQDSGKSPADELAEAVEACPDDNIFKADTVEECAQAAGIDAETLVATVERYNELCAAGKDEDFGKDASMMVAMEEGPFYLYRLDPNFQVAIGAIDTDRSMRVLDESGVPIEGLYAIGVDGVRLYRHVYPINCGATCCGNNVHSGRVAINHIASLISA